MKSSTGPCIFLSLLTLALPLFAEGEKPIDPAIVEDCEKPFEFSAQADDFSILLVDYQELQRDHLKSELYELGYNVTVASKVDEAIELFKENPTKFAVVELRLPKKPGYLSDRTGIDLMLELKKISPETIVLILTRYGSITYAVEAITNGADGFIEWNPDQGATAMKIEEAFQNRKNCSEPTIKHDEKFSTPTLVRTEWEHIHRVWFDCGGNVSKTAKLLGMHRRSLQRRLRNPAPPLVSRP